jgi:L-arabinose isomerase
VVTPRRHLADRNTNSRLRFTAQSEDPFDVAGWLDRWAAQGPTHHVALGVGHQLGTVAMFSRLAGMELVVVGP